MLDLFVILYLWCESVFEMASKSIRLQHNIFESKQNVKNKKVIKNCRLNAF